MSARDYVDDEEFRTGLHCGEDNENSGVGNCGASGVPDLKTELSSRPEVPSSHQPRKLRKRQKTSKQKPTFGRSLRGTKNSAPKTSTELSTAEEVGELMQRAPEEKKRKACEREPQLSTFANGAEVQQKDMAVTKVDVQKPQNNAFGQKKERVVTFLLKLKPTSFPWISFENRFSARYLFCALASLSLFFW